MKQGGLTADGVVKRSSLFFDWPNRAEALTPRDVPPLAHGLWSGLPERLWMTCQRAHVCASNASFEVQYGKNERHPNARCRPKWVFDSSRLH